MMRKRHGYPVYPLTAAQKFHFFYQNFCPKKEVLNVGTSLTIQAHDPETVFSCFLYAFPSSPLLSLSLYFISSSPANLLWVEGYRWE